MGGGDTDSGSGVSAAPGHSGRRLRRAAGIAAYAAAGVLAAAIRFHVTGHAQGIFLSRPREGSRIEVADDLLLGDGPRVFGGVAFTKLRALLREAAPMAPGEPFLQVEWDAQAGNGLVRSRLADGREIVTVFSRYEDSEARTPLGLFVGGSLPEAAADPSRQNESGMSIRDARGWRHVWCNANEFVVDSKLRVSYPSSWKFLGSRVLLDDPSKVVIESSHELEIDGQPVYMNRFAFFKAGSPFFRLGIRLVNAGDEPVRFTYEYGDEPWVGNFGSGEWNVGWVEEGIVRVEGRIDPRKHRWAGIFDERERLANFISWIGEELPDSVYFANQAGSLEPYPGSPLASNEVFIGLEWHDRKLEPGEGRSLLLSLGVAEVDEALGRPKLPPKAGPR